MTDTSIVEVQEIDDGDELINALEASHRGTEATSDKGEVKDNEDDKKETDSKDGKAEGDDSTGEDKAAVTDGKTEEEKAEEGKKDELEDAAAEAARIMADDNRELKTMLRKSAQREEILTKRLDRLEKGHKDLKASKKEVDEDAEDFDDKKTVKDEEVELSSIEQLQEKIDTVRETRAEPFNLMVEIMKNSVDYKDVEDVCSQANFDDLVDVIATDVAEKNNISISEATLAVQLRIWQQTNPYKYTYGLIKKYHPAYATDEKDSKKDEESSDTKGKKKTAKEVIKAAPGSVADMGGGSANKSGWTTEKILALPEEELSKVPTDIYDKYMAGELD